MVPELILQVVLVMTGAGSLGYLAITVYEGKFITRVKTASFSLLMASQFIVALLNYTDAGVTFGQRFYMGVGAVAGLGLIVAFYEEFYRPLRNAVLSVAR